MGYYSTIHGEFVIEPEIDEKHWPIKPPDDKNDAQFGYFLFENQPGNYDVKIVDGQMVVTSTPGSTVVQMFWEDSLKAYDFEEQCSLLFDWAKKQGSTITGIMRVEGEENGDVSRVRFESGQMHAERPTLTWPNGDVEHP